MELHNNTGHPRRWAILGVLVISLLVVVLDNTILNVALRTLADPVHGLGASQGELEWSINSYTLVFAGLLFTFGVLGDRAGRKRFLMIGLVLFGLASLLSAYAQSPGQLIAARALMGVGGAAIMPVTLSIISNVFDPRERGRAIGVWAGAVGLAVAIGPILGGALLEHFWWGSVFLINVPVVAAGVVLVALLVPESRDPRPGRVDVLGVAALGGRPGRPLLRHHRRRRARLRPAGGLGLDPGRPRRAGLVRRSTSGAATTRRWTSGCSRCPGSPRRSPSSAWCSSPRWASMFFSSFYLQLVRGYSPLQTGLLFLPFAGAQLVFAPRSAAMVRRYGGQGRRRRRAGADSGGARRVRLHRRLHPDLGRAARLLHPGRRDGQHHAAGHRVDHVGAAPGEGRCGLRGQQHHPPGGRRARRRRPRLGALRGLPQRHRRRADRPAARRPRTRPTSRSPGRTRRRASSARRRRR